MKLIFLLISLLSLNAFSNEDAVFCRKAVFVDYSGSLEIEDIKKTMFRDVQDRHLTFGFSPFKHWLKVECFNNGKKRFKGKYQFLYPVINTLNIYQNSVSSPLRLGFWKRDRKEHNFDTVLPQIDLHIEPKSSALFYVEALSEGSLQLQSQLISEDRGFSYLIKPAFFYGLFFGALMALMFYNLFLGISLRDSTYFFYCGYVIFFILYQITITGYAPTFFGEIGLHLTYFRAAYLHLLFFFITLFAKRFLLLKNNGPLMEKVLLGIAAIYAVAALLSPVLPTQRNLEFSAITSIIVPLMLIGFATVVLRKGFKPAKFFVVAWLVFLGAIVITAMRNIGALPKNWIVDHILEFGIISEVFLISLGLAFKVRLLESEKNIAATEAASEKLKVLELNSQLEKEKILSAVSAQVSHDIRSPLSALTMISATLTEVPEEKRVLILNSTQRINDIANQLLLKAKATKNSSVYKIENSCELLPGVIDAIITEKRMQYGNNPEIEIVSEVCDSYGAFANINANELKRVVSNLINNSVEAFENKKGRVMVTLSSTEKAIKLVVKDNGKGIPEDILKNVGTYGFSFEKKGIDSGHGLGIFHARQAIENWGGAFKMKSKVGVGTEVIITLPKATPTI